MVANFILPSLVPYFLWLSLETDLAFFYQTESFIFSPYTSLDFLWEQIGFSIAMGYVMINNQEERKSKIYNTLGIKGGIKFMVRPINSLSNLFVISSLYAGYIAKNCPELSFSLSLRYHISQKNIGIEGGFGTFLWFFEDIYLLGINFLIKFLVGII